MTINVVERERRSNGGSLPPNVGDMADLQKADKYFLRAFVNGECGLEFNKYCLNLQI